MSAGVYHRSSPPSMPPTLSPLLQSPDTTWSTNAPTNCPLLLQPAEWHRIAAAVEQCVSCEKAQKVKSIVYRALPVEIVPGVFLGTLTHSLDVRVLLHCRIAHIADCSASPLMRQAVRQQTADLMKQSRDLQKQSRDLMSLQDEAATTSPGYSHLRSIGGSGQQRLNGGKLDLADFAESLNDLVTRQQQAQRRNSNQSAKGSPAAILVCCLTGVNRAALAIAAYLMAYRKFTLPTTLELLRDKAGTVVQVEGLQELLLEFAVKKGCLGSSDEWTSTAAGSADADDVKNREEDVLKRNLASDLWMTTPRGERKVERVPPLPPPPSPSKRKGQVAAAFAKAEHYSLLD